MTFQPTDASTTNGNMACRSIDRIAVISVDDVVVDGVVDVVV